MKLRSVYTKIFLSFLVVLFITEVLVFFLFIMIPARQFAAQFEGFVTSKVLAVKAVVENRVQSLPPADWSKDVRLRDLISNLGVFSGAPVWLTRNDGTVALKSFSGEVPDVNGTAEKGRSARRWIFKRYAFKDFKLHTLIPIESSGRHAGDLHILFKRPPSPTPHGRFALGLLIIGAIVALAAIPVSRLVTKRITQLRRSALLIAEGDLSHRAPVKGKDEISDLARTFNDMTDKIEGMIASNKELTANISHELRAPLTRIRIAEELIREKALRGNGEDLSGHLDGIREDIEDLDGLVGRILDLSKLDVGRLPLRPEPLDPSDLIQELLEKFRPVMERKGLHVITDLPEGSTCTADKETLRLALRNVLDNAAKFTPEKGDILVRTARKPEGIVTQVVNTCERISEDDLARIFDPFHRAKQSAATGSGLGLTIARKAIERLGGTIQAANGEKGLEINITLPQHSVE